MNSFVFVDSALLTIAVNRWSDLLIIFTANIPLRDSVRLGQYLLSTNFGIKGSRQKVREQTVANINVVLKCQRY